MKLRHTGLLLTLFWLCSLLAPFPVAADGPVVYAVMFYSPSCGHCHHVIENTIVPLIEEHGTQFDIIGINVAEPGGQALYQAALEQFEIPPERRGVPTLIIAETVLVGSGEIPEQLPGLIEEGLTQGGWDWPAIPGLAEVLAESAPEPTPAEPTGTSAAPAPAEVDSPPAETPAPAIPGVVTEDWRARFARDPLGNGLSVAVLLGMLASAVYNGVALAQGWAEASWQRCQRAIPPLLVVGLVVAGYLAYVETQQVAAVCGPVGDCNTVQQSEFALLFGFLPIAVLGVLGYLAIGAAWIVGCYGSGRWCELARAAIHPLVWFGVLFSIYLTFLEPFVIGATCAWCLTSAVVMTLLLWVVTPTARPALRTTWQSVMVRQGVE